MIAIFHLQRGMPSKRKSSACIDYVPALCTHRPSLLPIEWSDENYGLGVWAAFVAYALQEVVWTLSFRGRRSRNKVSVGEPAEGSLTSSFSCCYCSYRCIVVFSKPLCELADCLREGSFMGFLVPCGLTFFCVGFTLFFSFGRKEGSDAHFFYSSSIAFDYDRLNFSWVKAQWIDLTMNNF